MDDAVVRKQAERGRQAKRIIEDPLVIEVFDKMDRTIREGWENSRAEDDLGRHNAYLMNRLLKNFKAQFEQILHKGNDADKQLLKINSDKGKKVI